MCSAQVTTVIKPDKKRSTFMTQKTLTLRLTQLTKPFILIHSTPLRCNPTISPSPSNLLRLFSLCCVCGCVLTWLPRLQVMHLLLIIHEKFFFVLHKLFVLLCHIPLPSVSTCPTQNFPVIMSVESRKASAVLKSEQAGLKTRKDNRRLIF